MITTMDRTRTHNAKAITRTRRLQRRNKYAEIGRAITTR